MMSEHSKRVIVDEYKCNDTYPFFCHLGLEMAVPGGVREVYEKA
jgi:hypothetical protein